MTFVMGVRREARGAELCLDLTGYNVICRIL